MTEPNVGDSVRAVLDLYDDGTLRAFIATVRWRRNGDGQIGLTTKGGQHISVPADAVAFVAPPLPPEPTEPDAVVIVRPKIANVRVAKRDGAGNWCLDGSTSWFWSAIVDMDFERAPVQVWPQSQPFAKDLLGRQYVKVERERCYRLASEYAEGLSGYGSASVRANRLAQLIKDGS